MSHLDNKNTALEHFNWVPSPGDTIQACLVEQQKNLSWLGSTLDLTDEEVINLIGGKHEINFPLARKLAQHLDFDIDFWMSLEASYREHLAKQSEV